MNPPTDVSELELHEVMAQDREWFVKHPNARWRFRNTYSAEQVQFRVLGGLHDVLAAEVAKLKGTVSWKIAVYQLEEGRRARIQYLTSDDPTDNKPDPPTHLLVVDDRTLRPVYTPVGEHLDDALVEFAAKYGTAYDRLDSCQHCATAWETGDVTFVVRPPMFGANMNLCASCKDKALRQGGELVSVTLFVHQDHMGPRKDLPKSVRATLDRGIKRLRKLLRKQKWTLPQ